MDINDKILKTLFLNMSEGIAVTDEEKKITLITPKVFNLLHVKNHNNLQTEDDLFSLTRSVLVKPGLLVKIKEYLNLEPNKSTSNVLELNNGEFIDLSSYPIISNKKFFGRIWMITDITEAMITAKRMENYIADLKTNEDRLNRKAFDLFQINNQLEKSRENLKNLNASKDKFFSIIAHDLKSPFTAFLGTTSMLAEDYDEFNDNERKELINSVNSTAKNIYNLLDNLLDWAQIQTGKLEFNVTEINISELINPVLELLKPMAESKKIKTENHISEFIEITCDPNMFSTIIRNLYSNAIKFTPEEGTISLSDEFVGDKYIFTITDNGIGMDSDEISNIFSETHKTRLGTNKEKGTGLGLILTKELVEKHHGELKIESAPKKGTSISVIIPQKAPLK